MSVTLSDDPEFRADIKSARLDTHPVDPLEPFDPDAKLKRIRAEVVKLRDEVRAIPHTSPKRCENCSGQISAYQRVLYLIDAEVSG